MSAKQGSSRYRREMCPRHLRGESSFRKMGNRLAKVPLLMDGAYEGRENRQPAKAVGMKSVILP